MGKKSGELIQCWPIIDCGIDTHNAHLTKSLCESLDFVHIESGGCYLLWWRWLRWWCDEEIRDTENISYESDWTCVTKTTHNSRLYFFSSSSLTVFFLLLFLFYFLQSIYRMTNRDWDRDELLLLVSASFVSPLLCRLDTQFNWDLTTFTVVGIKWQKLS